MDNKAGHLKDDVRVTRSQRSGSRFETPFETNYEKSSKHQSPRKNHNIGTQKFEDI
jgi:hypothetical protein